MRAFESSPLVCSCTQVAQAAINASNQLRPNNFHRVRSELAAQSWSTRHEDEHQASC